MPKFPASSPHVALIKGAIFAPPPTSELGPAAKTYRLNVGDTWLEPAAGCHMEDLRTAEWPGLHQYAPTQGLPDLLKAIAARVTLRSGLATAVDNVLVTASGTFGLSAIIAGIMEPGEEVIVLAPHWPLVAGAIRSFKGTPISVPFLGVARSPAQAIEIVAPHLTERTAAIYINTPNNPSGLVISKPILQALVSWAAAHDLWVIADDVYEDYQYDGAHVPARTLAPERTISLHSFTKAYGMAGNRVGYIVGPRDIIATIHKITTHIVYATPTAGQIAALRVLGDVGDQWIASARRLYQDVGETCAKIVGVPPPQAGTFLFLDVKHELDKYFSGSGLQGLLQECAERRLYVTPGPSFGPYPDHIRLCFTAAPPEIVERGVQILAEVLRR